jgi:hypothetical protein
VDVQAENAAALEREEPTAPDHEGNERARQLRGRLGAVAEEEAAVRAVLDGLAADQSEGGVEKEEEGGPGAGGAGDGGEATASGSGAERAQHGPRDLQLAVGRQRLVGLEAERQRLEVSFPHARLRSCVVPVSLRFVARSPWPRGAGATRCRSLRLKSP